MASFNIALVKLTRAWPSKMRTDTVGEHRGTNAVTVPGDTGTMERFTRSKELDEELVPGIPNDITLNLVTAKLSWGDLQRMYRVSRGWREAIQGGVVHDARVRTHSIETFHVVLDPEFPGESDSDNIHNIALCSQRDKSWHALPPIPDLRRGLANFCRCVQLKGKIYVFGGARVLMHYAGSTKVHVVDLAEQRSTAWTLVESHSFPEFGLMDRVLMFPCTSIPSDDQLLIHAFWYKRDLDFHGSGLYQSRGLCKGNQEIVWEKADCSCSREGRRVDPFSARGYTSSPCVIQL